MQFYEAYEIKVKEYQNFKTEKQSCCAACANPSKEAYYPAKKPPRKYVLIQNFWKEKCLNGGLCGSKLAYVNAFLCRPHWPA